MISLTVSTQSKWFQHGLALTKAATYPDLDMEHRNESNVSDNVHVSNLYLLQHML